MRKQNISQKNPVEMLDDFERRYLIYSLRIPNITHSIFCILAASYGESVADKKRIRGELTRTLEKKYNDPNVFRSYQRATKAKQPKVYIGSAARIAAAWGHILTEHLDEANPASAKDDDTAFEILFLKAKSSRMHPEMLERFGIAHSMRFDHSDMNYAYANQPASHRVKAFAKSLPAENPIVSVLGGVHRMLEHPEVLALGLISLSLLLMFGLVTSRMNLVTQSFAGIFLIGSLILFPVVYGRFSDLHLRVRSALCEILKIKKHLATKPVIQKQRAQSVRGSSVEARVPEKAKIQPVSGGLDAQERRDQSIEADAQGRVEEKSEAVPSWNPREIILQYGQPHAKPELSLPKSWFKRWNLSTSTTLDDSRGSPVSTVVMRAVQQSSLLTEFRLKICDMSSGKVSEALFQDSSRGVEETKGEAITLPIVKIHEDVQQTAVQKFYVVLNQKEIDGFEAPTRLRLMDQLGRGQFTVERGTYVVHPLGAQGDHRLYCSRHMVKCGEEQIVLYVVEKYGTHDGHGKISSEMLSSMPLMISCSETRYDSPRARSPNHSPRDLYHTMD